MPFNGSLDDGSLVTKLVDFLLGKTPGVVNISSECWMKSGSESASTSSYVLTATRAAPSIRSTIEVAGAGASNGRNAELAGFAASRTPQSPASAFLVSFGTSLCYAPVPQNPLNSAAKTMFITMRATNPMTTTPRALRVDS